MCGRIIVLVGQTASGKTTLARYLEQCGFERIVTYTTRPPRKGEQDGKDYHFIPEDDFLEKVDEGFFAERTEYHAEFGHVCYGTSKESLETRSGESKVIVLNPNRFSMTNSRYRRKGRNMIASGRLLNTVNRSAMRNEFCVHEYILLNKTG